MELGKIQNDEDKACPKWGWGSPDTTRHGDAGRCELPGVTGQVQVHRTSAASSAPGTPLQVSAHTQGWLCWGLSLGDAKEEAWTGLILSQTAALGSR